MRRPKVATLVGALFLLVLILPFVLLASVRLFESMLVRETEQVLLAEAVVVGEAYRSQLGATVLGPTDGEPYHPFPPQLSLGIWSQTEVLPPAVRRGEVRTSSATKTKALLPRVFVRNLAGTRVLNLKGEVVASTSDEIGYSLAHLPEVEAALRGAYHPVLRRRFSDDPTPPLTSLSRAATVRVSLAVPVYADPRAPVGSAEVLGAVYSSRTPLEPTRALWLWRERLLWPALVSVVVTLALVFLLTISIARPLARLRRYAQEVAQGASDSKLVLGASAPQELASLAESIQYMRSELEARASYIRDFATHIAHELKTPLTSIRGASELLLEDEMTPEQRHRFLSNVHADALRMDDLVRRILALARIESTRPQTQVLQLDSFLEAVAERYARHGHQVRISNSCGRSVRYDPEQLEMLLGNLLDNAFRHGGDAPVDLSLEVNDQVILTIRDRGPPLPPDHFHRAFERFFSTERARGGTGLGLALVKAIVDAHGGQVTARVEPVGASFSVTLPLA